MFEALPTHHLRSLAVALAALVLLPGAAAADDGPMRIAFPSGMNGQLVVTMDKAGIAQKNGLKAEVNSFQYGPPMMEALASGSIDAVVTSLMPVTSYASKLPGDVKIVAMLGHSSHSLMVAKESPAKSAPDLTGGKVGISFGSDSHLDMLVWLKELGLTDKITLVNVGPAELATALANRSVDAIVIRQPQVLRLQQLDARVLHTWPFRFVSIVKSNFIAARPAAFGKYLDTLHDALFYVAQNHEQTAAWFGEYLRVDPTIIAAVSAEDPNYTAAKLDDIDISVTEPARAMVQKWVDDAYAEKMIRNKVDTGALFR